MGIKLDVKAMTSDKQKGLRPQLKSLDDIWLVVRFDNSHGTSCEVWHIQGVATDEATASEMCIDETYYIGPLTLNELLPEERVEWVGSYCPLKRKRLELERQQKGWKSKTKGT